MGISTTHLLFLLQILISKGYLASKWLGAKLPKAAHHRGHLPPLPPFCMQCMWAGSHFTTLLYLAWVGRHLCGTAPHLTCNSLQAPLWHRTAWVLRAVSSPGIMDCTGAGSGSRSQEKERKPPAVAAARAKGSSSSSWEGSQSILACLLAACSLEINYSSFKDVGCPNYNQHRTSNYQKERHQFLSLPPIG